MEGSPAQSPYSTGFFELQRTGSYASASLAVPHVLRVVAPKSVIDVGCGVGSWARAFMDNGVEDVRGVDGDYVDRDKLVIPPDRFRATDLATETDIGRADLVCCLEVAEHLDESVSERFVDLLVSAAPMVLFSAAIPGQGGTHHVNERWQSYWVEKFRRRGYVALDAIRPLVWNERRIGEAYRQNMLLFCHADHVPDVAPPEAPDFVWDRVHPELWLARERLAQRKLAQPQSIREAVDVIVIGLRVIGTRVLARLGVK